MTLIWPGAMAGFFSFDFASFLVVFSVVCVDGSIFFLPLFFSLYFPYTPTYSVLSDFETQDTVFLHKTQYYKHRNFLLISCG